jgi:Lrp/AsnC family leucine-responsive transcriptional regulator
VTFETKLDHVDWQILELLQQNARLSYAEIGRRVGLSSPAAAERVRRVEEAGIIQGYHARINPAKIGRPVMVFIQARVPVERYAPFKDLVSGLSEIVECHHVTGNEAFILKAVLKSIAYLEPLVTQLSQYGQTTTSIVMSTQVQGRVISFEV